MADVALNYSLVPPDDAEIAPGDDIDAAEASALGDPYADEATPAPEPFGLTWVFDFEAGQFVRQGAAPAEASTDEASLEQWCLMVLYSARFAHAVFDDDIGIEYPTDPLGELGSREWLGDYAERMREALMQHERIADVTNFQGDFEQATGVLRISGFDVMTDEGETVSVGAVAMNVGRLS
jgi:hypothetical protein